MTQKSDNIPRKLHGTLLFECLEERVVLDAAPWDGAWNDLGDGYWFQYDAASNDQFWWHGGTYDDYTWLRFDPETQQWSQTTDSGATWTDLGDPGAPYADVTEPAETFIFDGSSHVLYNTAEAGTVSFEYDGSRYGYWELGNYSYEFAYDYTTGAWWLIQNPWLWIPFTDAGASSEFLFDGDLHHDVALFTSYEFDLDNLEGVWYVGEQLDLPDYEVMLDYTTGRWSFYDYTAATGDTIAGIDGTNFVYNGEWNEVEPGVYFAWDYTYDSGTDIFYYDFSWSNVNHRLTFDTAGGGEDPIVDERLKWGYSYNELTREAFIYYDTVMYELAFDQVSPDWWLSVYDGSWYEFIDTDKWFRFDPDQGWVEWWYHNSDTDYDYWFSYDLTDNQWYERIAADTYRPVGDASGGNHLESGDQAPYYYDGYTHAVGLDDTGRSIYYRYDGFYAYWITLTGSVQYAYDYAADQWYQSDDTGNTWYTLESPGYNGYFMFSGTEHDIPQGGEFPFVYDAAAHVGEYSDYGHGFVFQYDYRNGGWEWNPRGEFLELISPLDSGQFVFDGQTYALENGLTYYFNNTTRIGESSWIFEGGLTISYNNYLYNWFANEDAFVQDDGQVPSGNPNDVVSDIMAGNWYRITEGDFSNAWFSVDMTYSGIYWWYNNSGTEHYFWYGSYGAIDQWWIDADGYGGADAWTTFGSWGEESDFIYDGRTHIIENGVSFRLDLTDPGSPPGEGYYDFTDAFEQPVTFAYDYQWEQWRMDEGADGIGWTDFGSPGELSWFAYDGNVYELPSGWEYDYDSDSGTGHWSMSVEAEAAGLYDGVHFTYDYSSGQWTLYDWLTDAFIEIGDTGVVSTLLSGQSHEYETGEFMRADGLAGRIYWWTATDSFYFDVTDGRWYQERGSSWEAFGSQGETPIFLFDGDVHTNRSAYEDNISFRLDAGRYGMWNVEGIDLWAYDYVTGQWWRFDASESEWLGFDGPDALSWFIFDGNEWTFGEDGYSDMYRNLWYDYDEGLFHNQIRYNGGWINFAYDVDGHQWHHYNIRGGLNPFGPSHASFDLTDIRQELEPGYGVGVELVTEHGNAYWSYNGDDQFAYNEAADSWYEWDSGWMSNGGVYGFYAGIGAYWGLTDSSSGDVGISFYNLTGGISSPTWQVSVANSSDLAILTRPWDHTSVQVLVTDEQPLGINPDYDPDASYASTDTIWIDSSWTDIVDLTDTHLSYVHMLFGDMSFLAFDNDGAADLLWFGNASVNYSRYMLPDQDVSYHNEFVQIGGYLTDAAEIQFYASSVASTTDGQNLLSEIASDAGADVYASTDQFAYAVNQNLEWGSDGGSRTSSELIFDPASLSALLDHP